MERMSWWSLLAIVAVTVLVFVVTVRSLWRKYQARWPWLELSS